MGVLRYVAERDAESGKVVAWVVTTGAPAERWKPLNPRLDLFRHSPDGFELAYAGSGPAQLALAILAHHVRQTRSVPIAEADAYAVRHHQRFKFDFLANERVRDRFEITPEDLNGWLAAEDARRPAPA